MSTILNATIASGLQVSSDNSGVIQFQQNGSNTVTIPAGTGTVAVQGVSTNIVSGTSQASTSGTSIDFTSIPSWVKRITVMFNGVSGNGSSSNIIQIGSGSFETTGYKGSVTYFSSSSMATYQTGGTGILINQSISGAQLLDGHVVLTNVSSNNWVASFNLANEVTGNAWSGAGAKTLSGTLDRIRITTVNGTDTFDAGSINILYE
jgi:hypothetical protein